LRKLRIAVRILREFSAATGLTNAEKAIYTALMMKNLSSYGKLKAETEFCHKTLVKHCKSLEQHGWLNRTVSLTGYLLTPVLPEEVESRIASEVLETINLSPYKGEATAVAAIEWIVAPTVTIIRNARPSFLKNPDTNQPMEFDIFLPEWRWAGEYHGDQHFGPTKLYPGEKEFVARFGRDQAKERLARENSVRLSIFRKYDLCIARISELIPGNIPRRPYAPDGPFVKMIGELGKDIAGTEYRDREH